MLSSSDRQIFTLAPTHSSMHAHTHKHTHARTQVQGFLRSYAMQSKNTSFVNTFKSHLLKNPSLNKRSFIREQNVCKRYAALSLAGTFISCSEALGCKVPLSTPRRLVMPHRRTHTHTHIQAGGSQWEQT